ncbi:tyrosine-type recombinase/integrase [Micromonospora peucetia]|uniref:tyrosine-type recombinase/integrase n=1 Tax=Micromonospora peucetia TaxID=47871 RepID=UPI00338E765D
MADGVGRRRSGGQDGHQLPHARTGLLEAAARAHAPAGGATRPHRARAGRLGGSARRRPAERQHRAADHPPVARHGRELPQDHPGRPGGGAAARADRGEPCARVGSTRSLGQQCPICGAEHVDRQLKPPKSRAGRRWVPLAAPALAALARHRAAQQIERDLFGVDYDDHDLVFCRPDGTPPRPDRVTVEFEQRVRACGLPVVRLHDTRHGACSLMLAGGVPIEVVQMIFGHAGPEVTRRIYKHMLRKETAKQVEKASKLLTRHRPKRKAP